VSSCSCFHPHAKRVTNSAHYTRHLSCKAVRQSALREA
jgi:hypothetical protein